MDPRWGASNRRIEFSIDVQFTVPSENNIALANKDVRGRMVQDSIFGGASSDVYVLKAASKARLRNGFDSMKCEDGAYRLDAAKNDGSTVRFYIRTDGTPEVESSYGDIFVPKGFLYFSCLLSVVSLYYRKKQALLQCARLGGTQAGGERRVA